MSDRAALTDEVTAPLPRTDSPDDTTATLPTEGTATLPSTEPPDGRAEAAPEADSADERTMTLPSAALASEQTAAAGGAESADEKTTILPSSAAEGVTIPSGVQLADGSTTALPRASTAAESTTLPPEMQAADEHTTVLPTPATADEHTTVLPTPAIGDEHTTILPAPAAGDEDTTVLSGRATGDDNTTVLPGRAVADENTTVISSASMTDKSGTVDAGGTGTPASGDATMALPGHAPAATPKKPTPANNPALSAEAAAFWSGQPQSPSADPTVAWSLRPAPGTAGQVPGAQPGGTVAATHGGPAEGQRGTSAAGTYGGPAGVQSGAAAAGKAEGGGEPFLTRRRLLVGSAAAGLAVLGGIAVRVAVADDDKKPQVAPVRARVASTRSRQPESATIKPAPPVPVQRKAISTLAEYRAATGAPAFPADSVALTIDDGPHPVWTPKILGLLEKYDVPAIFCMIGNQVLGHEATAKMVTNAGHQLANHTWSHPIDLPHEPPPLVHKEIFKAQQKIQATTGYAPKLFRSPGGGWSPALLHETAQAGLLPLDWSVDPRDWSKPGVPTIEHKLLAARPGQILLCHDGGGDRSQTYAALSVVLPALKAKGLHFVAL